MYPGYESPYYDESNQPKYSQDLINNGVYGVDGISPKAKAAIGEATLNLIELSREQMIRAAFDPFLMEIKDITGTVQKPAGVMPTEDWINSGVNFFTEGIVPPAQ